MVTVLVPELRVQPRSTPLVLVHATVEVLLTVRNCEGNWMSIKELRGTAGGEAVKTRLTGSNCRLMMN